MKEQTFAAFTIASSRMWLDIDDLRDRAEKGSVVAQGVLGLAHLFGMRSR